jgi:riboflavin kinase/FMN adenylyltransferase
MSEVGIDLVHGVEGLRPEHGPLFAVIGVFDGIHLGHRYLLSCLVEEAHRRSARPAVITFDSHPDEILVGAAPPVLLDPTERIRMLGEAGVEVVVIQHFDAALRSTEYDEFVHRITSRTRLAGILMTPDAAFGHDRRGTPEAIRTLGDVDGFDLVVVPPFALEGRSVRSSEIREAIGSGDFQTAEQLLGRPYAVVGEAGRDGTLEFQMPVASPPAGTYRVIVDGTATTVNVDETGTMRLGPPTSWPFGSRLSVEFAAGGESA